MLKLKLQYFGHLMQRFFGKDPDAGKDWRQWGEGDDRDKMVGWYHQLNGHDLSKLQEMLEDRGA